MAKSSDKLHRILLAEVSSILKDGYRQVGTIGDTVMSFRHTNGNRLTLILDDTQLCFIVNGRLKKQVSVSVGEADPAPCLSGHVINPK